MFLNKLTKRSQNKVTLHEYCYMTCQAEQSVITILKKTLDPCQFSYFPRFYCVFHNLNSRDHQALLDGTKRLGVVGANKESVL